MADLKQQLAQKQDELARLKERMKKQDAGQKIVIGGLVLAEARSNPKIAEWLINLAKEKVREVDLKRIQPALDELIKTLSETEHKSD